MSPVMYPRRSRDPRPLARPLWQGRYLTPIRSARWLAAPVAAPGRPGLWDAAVPAAALPP